MNRPLDIRRLRNIFLCGYGASLSGDWLAVAAVGWLLREEMNLNGSIYGMVSAVSAFTFLLSSPIAGKIVRERSLSSILLISNLLLGLGSFLICYGIKSQTITLFLIVLIRISTGIFSAFKEVGEVEYLKRLIGESESKAVISTTSNMYYVARAGLGFVSAIVLSTLGTAWLFAIDGASFVLMAISLISIAAIGGIELISRLKSPFTVQDGATLRRSEGLSAAVIGRFRDYSQSFSYVATRPDLRLLLLLTFLLEGFGYTCWLLAPTVILVSFHEDSGYWYGMFLSISGIGGLIGMQFYKRAVRLSAKKQRSIFPVLTLLNVIFIGLLSICENVVQFSIIYALAIFAWAPFISYVKTFFLHQQESALANGALQCVIRGIAPLSRWMCVSVVILLTSNPLHQTLICAVVSGAFIFYSLIVCASWRKLTLDAMFGSSAFRDPSIGKVIDEAV